MMTPAHNVQVLSLAINAANITHQQIDGDDHIIIRGVVPVVDDIVMNGGLYPAAEINASFNSIEGNLMPLSHPRVDGQYVSANDPRAVNAFHAGAWAQNVRKDGDRVVMDVYVNTRVAAQTENGQRLLDRIAAMESGSTNEPIQISTGLLLNREQAKGRSKGKPYSWIARNMRFDHVAILMDEPAAGSPEQGVGIFVNADGSQLQVEIAQVEDHTDPHTNDETLIRRIVNQMAALFSANQEQQPEEEPPMKNMIINALKAKGVATDGLTDEQLFNAFNALQLNQGNPQPQPAALDTAAITAAVNAAMEPTLSKLAALEAQVNAGVNAELQAKRDAIKAKFGWTDAAVNSLEGEALQNMYAATQTAAPLNAAFNHSQEPSDAWAGYDLNQFNDEAK